MPSETFLRLPEEKRNRFLEAAWTEFTRVSFADASINQIVRGAEIPRGSFYQYFADKEELFAYLLEQIRLFVSRGYQALLREVDGDLFRLQLAAYDGFLLQSSAPEPMVDRCIRLIRLNLGMDLQHLAAGAPGRQILEDLWPELDATIFRQQDGGFIWRAFSLSLAALAGAVMKTLASPESAMEARKELCSTLEIIQYGCLCPSGQRAKEAL